MNYNSSIPQESHSEVDPFALLYSLNQMQNDDFNIDLASQENAINGEENLNVNLNMNNNAAVSEEESKESLPWGHQINQMPNENSNIYHVPQGRTFFNDGGFQQFAVNALPAGFAYRGRTSCRGNSSTTCSLSPEHKVPQGPINNMFTRLPSTNYTTAGQMLDFASEDEGNFNENQEKSPKSLTPLVKGFFFLH